MKLTSGTMIMVASLVGGTLTSQAEFQNFWTLGIDNDNQSEFAQERGTNPPPGSATEKDDDYYFAGVYPDPIGMVEVDENQMDPTNNTRNGLTGFERALTTWDATNRIHFNLDPQEVEAEFRITIDLRGGGSSGSGFGIHDLDVSMNGNLLASTTVNGEDQLWVHEFSGADAAAVGGENIIEITRTGGSESAWIQLDYLTLEIDRAGLPCAESICSFSATQSRIAPGESVDLNWFTNDSAILSIDQGVGPVAAGAGTVTVSPTATTTYTLSSTLEGVVTTGEVVVEVDLLTNFSADVVEVTPDAPDALLSWEVDPGAGVTVAIDNGIGDVTAETIAGQGSISVSPTANTIYTITVTRPNVPVDDVATGTVSVRYNNFNLLWRVGEIDDSQAEFSQEDFVQNDVSVGSPSVKDDDYFLAGDYGGTTGVVAADEDWLNFNRAVTAGDPNNRFHFTLTPEQAAANSAFRLTVDLFGGGWWNAALMESGGTFGTHDIVIRVNGTEIYNQPGIVGSTFIQEEFSAGEVGMVAGGNIIEVSRPGGDSAGDGGNNGWIQFDYTQLDIVSGSLDEFAITDVTFLPASGRVILSFPSSAGQTFTIESSATLNDDWVVLNDNFTADEEENTSVYVHGSGEEFADRLFFRVTRN